MSNRQSIIWRYANRKLYEQGTGYLHHVDLLKRIKRGEPFTVINRENNVDVTDKVLLGIVASFEGRTTPRMRVAIRDFIKVLMHDAKEPELPMGPKAAP